MKLILLNLIFFPNSFFLRDKIKLKKGIHVTIVLVSIRMHHGNTLYK